MNYRANGIHFNTNSRQTVDCARWRGICAHRKKIIGTKCALKNTLPAHIFKCIESHSHCLPFPFILKSREQTKNHAPLRCANTHTQKNATRKITNYRTVRTFRAFEQQQQQRERKKKHTHIERDMHTENRVHREKICLSAISRLLCSKAGASK